MRNMSSSRRAGAKLAASLSSSPCTPRTCRITQRAQCLSTAPRRHQVSAAVKLPSNAAANADKVQHDLSPSDESEPLRSLTDGLQDPPPVLNEDERQVDWTRSYHGLSATPFTAEQAAILQEPIDFADIEIKPDGIVYLPEIKYRRKLNKAFGPGGWGLAPRGETIVTDKIVTREYGLVCGGRLVSIARGEQQYFDPDGIPTATEGCKSNALMRCCKDLGIASELWDPRFIRKFMSEMAKEMLVEHATTKKRRKHFMRKDDELKYPWKEISAFNDANKTNVAAAYKTARPPGTPATASGVTSAAAQAFQNAKTKVQTPSLPVKAAPVKK